MGSAALNEYERRYEQAVGRDALARQASLAAMRYLCCGELRREGHHPLCSEYVPPKKIEGQEELF